jgi:hypothetical protein
MRVIATPTPYMYFPASVQVTWPLFTPAAELHYTASQCPDPEVWRAAIFDALALNTDRNATNWGFVDGMPERPKLIDHGHAFDAAQGNSYDFIDLKQNEPIPDSYMKRIHERLIVRGMPTRLVELLPEQTVDRIRNVAHGLVNDGVFSV